MNLRKNRASRQTQLRAPCPFGRIESSFLRVYAEERQCQDANTRGFGLAPCYRGRAFPDGLPAQSAENWCSQTGTSKAHIPNTGSDELAPSTFNPPLEYSTDKVVLFWQSPSFKAVP